MSQNWVNLLLSKHFQEDDALIACNYEEDIKEGKVCKGLKGNLCQESTMVSMALKIQKNRKSICKY